MPSHLFPSHLFLIAICLLWLTMLHLSFLVAEHELVLELRLEDTTQQGLLLSCSLVIVECLP